MYMSNEVIVLSMLRASVSLGSNNYYRVLWVGHSECIQPVAIPVWKYLGHAHVTESHRVERIKVFSQFRQCLFE
jgi:hypothetical protein